MPSASAFNTTAPGCSPAAPCDITSTVGPITIGSNDLTIVANSAGIEPTFSSSSDSPTYLSGGTITGTKGQTCNLSNFTVGSASGIDPTYSSVTNSPTYTSGGVISGSTGQTCSLSDFNGVTGATATVVLTSANTIAAGTRLSITNEGSGATTPPTTATLGNGTATCSGTANVITQLTTSSGLGFSVIGAAATVALTSANTIASGTHLTVTASGYGATTPPTTALLTNGSATCSGTANVITSLTGTGVFTAQNPGSTSVFGSVSGVNSVAVPYLTCPAASIMVHDAASPNTTFTTECGWHADAHCRCFGHQRSIHSPDPHLGLVRSQPRSRRHRNCRQQPGNHHRPSRRERLTSPRPAATRIATRMLVRNTAKIS